MKNKKFSFLIFLGLLIATLLFAEKSKAAGSGLCGSADGAQFVNILPNDQMCADGSAPSPAPTLSGTYNDYWSWGCAGGTTKNCHGYKQGNDCNQNICPGSTCWNGFQNVNGRKECNASCWTGSSPNSQSNLGNVSNVNLASGCNLNQDIAQNGAWTWTQFTCQNGYWVKTSGAASDAPYECSVSWNDTCGNSTNKILYCPVDGQCGSANGGSFATAPNSNLCAFGTASVVSLTTQQCTDPCSGNWADVGWDYVDREFNSLQECRDWLGSPTCTNVSPHWSWTCAGDHGGNPASCSASMATDNGCAANTCTQKTCWNNTAFVSGTKTCVDNGCAANTCTTDPACFNGIDWVSGTKNCAAAAATSNGCEANTCIGSTCDNGVISNAAGTKTPVYGSGLCVETDATCAPDDCGKTITTTSFTCQKFSTNGCGAPQSCDSSGCPAAQTTNCPCPVHAGDWKEVTP